MCSEYGYKPAEVEANLGPANMWTLGVGGDGGGGCDERPEPNTCID